MAKRATDGAKRRQRFDLGALRERAGTKAFVRGESYFRDGQVDVLAIEADRVLAQVAGTDDYRTVVTGRRKTIGGQCSCPAFDDWGFCKHMVAVALAANEAEARGETDDLNPFARIRAHLRAQGVEALVDLIIELAERDQALLQRLDTAAVSLDGNDKVIEARLRKSIDRATRTGDYVDDRAAAGWAAGVESVLDTLAGLAAGPRAALALDLAEYAIDGIDAAVGSIDDSDGYCDAILERAGDIHIAAARAARPEPVGLAQNLFARELAVSHASFQWSFRRYVDLLGEEGLTEYRRLAREAWEKLPARAGRIRPTEASELYDRLQSILDFFAERERDVDARIALRAKNLSSPWRYLQLAQFCLAQGRAEEALRRAEEGLWLFEDDGPDLQLLFFATELLAKAKRSGDAEAHLWRAFEKAPNPELYSRLRKLGGKPARDRAIQCLELQLSAKKRPGWIASGDLLIEILLTEEMFDAAWTAVRKHGASLRLKQKLARASETTHRDEVVQTYAELIEHFAKSGASDGYAHAAALIARMANLQGASEHATFLAGIKHRFGRRWNFMKLVA